MEPPTKYWIDLKTKLCSRSDVVVDAAYGGLRALCQSTQIWKLEDGFWNFARDSLDQENSRHLSDLIDCISIVQRNVANENSIISMMNRRFSEKLMRIVLQRIEGAVSQAMSCLATMLATEELLAFMEKALTEAFRLESDDEYGRQYGVLSETAKALYKKKSEDFRKWLYEQMENPDPKAAKRACYFYINLS